jgi:hypothetical protein
MTVLPQGERELLDAHERLKRRRARRFLGLPSRIDHLGHRHRLTERGAHSRRSGTHRPTPRITAGTVALLASVAVSFGIAAVFLLSTRHPHAPTRPAERSSSPKTGQYVSENGIDQALIRNFKILRRPLRPSDRLPAALAQIATPSAPIIGDSRPASLGLLPKLAREATLPGTGFRAWLIPGRHGLCWDAEYAGHELGASCSSFQNSGTALAATDGYDSVRTRTGLITIGLVTDRVLALELVRPHGQRTRVPISDGFYAGSGISGKNLIENLIALTANGPQILPRASSELVFDAVGSPTASAPTPRQRGPLLARVRLRSPAGGRTPEGIAEIYNSTYGDFLSLTLSGVRPTVPHNGYAVWLYSTPRAARLLGFITERLGHVTTSGFLPSDAGRYREILVTLETQTRPKTPGKIILNAPLSLSK